MTRTIFLLAASHSYRAGPFLAAAAELGLAVRVVTDVPAPLANLWQQPLGVDFNDVPAATAALIRLGQEHQVGAILAVDDSGSLLAARASAALGLPHNAPAAAEAARDKLLMRSLLAPAGVPCPAFFPFTTADDPAAIAAQVPYPCVVKPTRRSGSQGVMRADTPAELVATVGRLGRLLVQVTGHPGPHPILVESFIPGFEVALEGLLDGGQLHVLALFDKPDPLDGPFFEETIYVTPSRLPAGTQQAIAACAAQAAAALGLRQGPVHAELRVNAAGPWLVEVAGRSIGGLCSRILRFGVDEAAGEGASLEALILRQAAGLPLPPLNREAAARGVMMIPIPAGGLLRRVAGLAEAKALPGIDDVEITAPLNNLLRPLPEGDSYLGFIFARGDSPGRVEAALRQAHQQLDFTIEPVISLAGTPQAT